MKSYRELEVWQRSCDLVLEIYKLTSTFPHTEQYGLINQMRRAAISIPSNIAEGFSRRTLADNHNFVRIAFASGAELETQIYLAEKLKLAQTKQFKAAQDALEVIMKMLNKLGQSLTSG
ncbi:MAG: four helix bundle protein [Candidatus Veblenbacteria bacterium]|nr:four helix bundle protein [Candidatus Veblenbacteria bacterium]